jgi:hypothetical protein
MKKIFIILFCALVLTASLWAATKYTVTINITREALQYLHANNFLLYGFKAVKSSAPEGQPLVWMVTDNYMETNVFTWIDDQYGVYISHSSIVQGGIIVASQTVPIDLGDIFTILPSGFGRVTGGGAPGKITIVDEYSKSQLTTGISQMVNGQMGAECAFPIMVNEVITIEPAECVAFFFATQRYEPGTVIMQAPNAGIRVCMCGATSKTVVFDKNGWLDNRQPCVTQIPAGAPLAEYLINPDQQNKKKTRR